MQHTLLCRPQLLLTNDPWPHRLLLPGLSLHCLLRLLHDLLLDAQRGRVVPHDLQGHDQLLNGLLRKASLRSMLRHDLLLQELLKHNVRLLRRLLLPLLSMYLLQWRPLL